MLDGNGDSIHVAATIDIPLGLVAAPLWRKAHEAMLAVVLLAWLRRCSLLCWRTLLLWSVLIFARERVFEIGDEAMERLMELIEERHAAALGR